MTLNIHDTLKKEYLSYIVPSLSVKKYLRAGFDSQNKYSEVNLKCENMLRYITTRLLLELATFEEEQSVLREM